MQASGSPAATQGSLKPNATLLDSSLISQLCGFDPLELLETVDFPNDRFERLLRISRDARMLAIQRLPIPLQDTMFDEYEDESMTTSTRPSSSTHTSRLNHHRRKLTHGSSVTGHSQNLFDLEAEINFTTEIPSTPFHTMHQQHGGGGGVGGVGGMRGEKFKSKSRQQSVARKVSEAEKREEELMKDQLARSAAAISIQCIFRGWTVRRKYLAVVASKLTVESNVSGGEKNMDGLPSVDDFSIQERLVRKYKKYIYILEKKNTHPNLLPDFPQFCATKIAATFKMSVFRRSYLKIKQMSVEEKKGMAAKEVLDAMMWKAGRGAAMEYQKTMNFVNAVVCIQRAWRSFYALKIYRFYRDLIKFRERGDPGKLLKFVNPKEAKLIDNATGYHVRFRLGGTKFPPTIYYKIFVHSSLIDMNAFSPRDYTLPASKQLPPRVLFSKTGPLPDTRHPTDGWYNRSENNGWRPVSDRIWDERNDNVTQRTTKSTLPFHFSKLKRRQEMERMRKLKKLEWMKAMYSQGKKLITDNPITTESHENPTPFPTEIHSHVSIPMHASKHQHDDVESISSLASTNKLQSESELLHAISKLEEELDHEFMMKWSRALDFDAYTMNWLSLSTTGKSDDPTTFEIELDDALSSVTAESYKLGPPSIVVSQQQYQQQQQQQQTDILMAEIDLFRKIAAETQQPQPFDPLPPLPQNMEYMEVHKISGLNESDGGSVVDSDSAAMTRPWSGRSERSMKDLFLGGGGGGGSVVDDDKSDF